MAESIESFARLAEPRLALSYDRMAQYRDDPEWIQAQWDAPTTRVLVMAGARIRLTSSGVPWSSPAQAPDGTRVLLGQRSGITYFALITSPDGTGEDWRSLRAALGQVPSEELDLVIHAVGVAEWLWRTRFCPRCAGRLHVHQLGHVLVCQKCSREEFPRTDPAVIMIVVDTSAAEERCLLGRNVAWPADRYSTLAGFVEPGESMEQAVRREVAEEVGIQVGAVQYLGNQPWPFPRSLMVGFMAHAETTTINVDGAELSHARWFTRKELYETVSTGSVRLPSGVSISRALIEHWYGEPLPGQW